MRLHEKSLELNITHEILNLADSWYWFLIDTPLWRYWRPRYMLPFFKAPKSTCGGFHTNLEGTNDPTGENGGGYDVRIKAGLGNHLLFIQYKKGNLITTSPSPRSVFSTPPYDHYKFEINGTTTNQHFTLRELANGIGGNEGNAVVYALPLIADMDELERNAGKLIRKTKFISIKDIDKQAEVNNVKFKKNKTHNFRVGKFNMNRCEVNYYYFFFYERDKSPDIISDIIALKFQKTLTYFIKEIKSEYNKYNLYAGYIPEGVYQSYIQYKRFLLHYFEVSPDKVASDNINLDYFPNYKAEFEKYENAEHDIDILNSVFKELYPFELYLETLRHEPGILFDTEVPSYSPKFLIELDNNGLNIKLQEKDSNLNNLTYMML